MKFSFISMFLLSIIFITSCSKSNDSSSDIADAYVGTYLVTDTLRITYSGTTTVQGRTYVMSVVKASANTVTLKNIERVCTVDAIVTSNIIGSTTGGVNDCQISNIVGQKNGAVLNFTYQFTTAATNYCTARAVKQ